MDIPTHKDLAARINPYLFYEFVVMFYEVYCPEVPRTSHISGSRLERHRVPAQVSTVHRIRSGTYRQVPNFAKNRAVLVGTSVLWKLLLSSIFLK